jgi:hypothetical protein
MNGYVVPNTRTVIGLDLIIGCHKYLVEGVDIKIGMLVQIILNGLFLGDMNYNI